MQVPHAVVEATFLLCLCSVLGPSGAEGELPGQAALTLLTCGSDVLLSLECLSVLWA